MTDLQAAKILDPKTTLEAYAEAEYYGGFEGAKRWKEDVEEACIRGAKALRAEPERLQAELEREKTMHQHTAEVAWAHEAELEKVKREHDALCEYLAEWFDCPCNFSPTDEKMFDFCGEDCDYHNVECWRRVSKMALKEGRKANER